MDSDGLRIFQEEVARRFLVQDLAEEDVAGTDFDPAQFLEELV